MSNATRNYLKDFDYRLHGHTASASQMSTYLGCPRKWWFQKVLRIPEIQAQQKFIFGNRLHEACERYMLSDDTGRDIASGEPYELWPEGWDEGLSAHDAGIMKQLVEMGIAEGVLRRTPGRRVEAPFFHTIAPDVAICGYRDVAAPGLVEDHKSIKARKWKSSRKALVEDPQLLIYAAIDIREQMTLKKQTLNPDDEITLRHNQFIKDPDDLFVQPCEATVTVAEVMEFWEDEIEPSATEMLMLKQDKLPASKWDEVEGVRKKGTCRDYGGCPFADVCGGIITPQALRARVERINELPTEPEPETTGATNMGIFDRMKKDTKTADKPKTERNPKPRPAAIEVVEETGVVEITEDLIDENDTPPWAIEECAACQGTGFSTSGEPCRACDRVTAKNKGIPSAAFQLAVDDEGFTTWTAGGVQVGRAKLTSQVKVGDDTKPVEDAAAKKAKAKAVRAAKKAAKAAAAQEAAEAVEVVEAAEVEAPADVEAAATTAGLVEASTTLTELEKAKPGRGRPAMGWTLVYGAVRRSKFPIVDLNELFHTYAQQLAERSGVANYYLLERFKRVDAMKALAGDVAGFIKPGSIVTVRTGDRDINSFASAIEVYASVVLEGNG